MCELVERRLLISKRGYSLFGQFAVAYVIFTTGRT